MIYFAHRVNTRAQLAQTPRRYGVELDLRDHLDRLVLQHDPFQGSTGEDFSDYLADYAHGPMILNIKSERIEHRVLEALRGTRVPDYFFLDSSYPMIKLLASQGVRKIAVRFSEVEPIEGPLALAGMVDWVWIDCFSRLPLDDRSHARLKEHFKLCVVSPELQKHPLERIAEFAKQVRDYPVDAVCTKRPDLWEAVLEPQATAPTPSPAPA